MNAVSVVLLALIAVAIVFALRSGKKHGGCGGCSGGDCAGCPKKK